MSARARIRTVRAVRRRAALGALVLGAAGAWGVVLLLAALGQAWLAG